MICCKPEEKTAMEKVRKQVVDRITPLSSWARRMEINKICILAGKRHQAVMDRLISRAEPGNDFWTRECAAAEAEWLVCMDEFLEFCPTQSGADA